MPKKVPHGPSKQVLFDLLYNITVFKMSRLGYDLMSFLRSHSGISEHIFSLVAISIIYNCQ